MPSNSLSRQGASQDPLQQLATRLRMWGLLAMWSEVDPDLRQRLCDAQLRENRSRSMERRLAISRIGRFKQMADFDWSWPQAIDREGIEDVLTLGFMNDAANVILIGPNGVGKTMIARNIAYQALLAGHTVRFVTASAMLADLAAQETASARHRRLKRYTTPALLAIDELGYLSYDNRYADLLYEVISARHLKRSTVVTTNRPFSEWPEVFPNAACVVTLVDRLTNYSDVAEIHASSYRLKEARERRAVGKDAAATRRRERAATP
jgi:DNA replication protein DnaC